MYVVMLLRKSASVQEYDWCSKGFFSCRPCGDLRTSGLRILAKWQRAERLPFLNIDKNNIQQHSTL